jgi:spore maturation protein CgeB
MKVLIVGDWHSDLHEQEVLRSLTRLGHQVTEFKWCSYFSFDSKESLLPKALIKRAQNKFVSGPLLKKINEDFLAKAIQVSPDVIFVYRGTHINADALRAAKKAITNCVLVGYNNDDPFSPAQPRYLWRHFIQAIPEYDLVLAYRHANIDSFRSVGAKRVELLRSWYVPDRSYPVDLSSEEKSHYETDVVFIGHYEPDQRLEYLEEIVRQGFRLRLFGPTKYWAKPLAQSPILHRLAPTQMVWAGDYNRALCGAKVALCFFSKLNRDTYTRRCFEIPATKTLMLSEYSDDLASMYAEGVEADYFRDCDEMMRKIRMRISDDSARRRVAEGGYEKVQSAGHDIDSRMKQMLGWIAETRKSQGCK